jgi:hypothetical protein
MFLSTPVKIFCVICFLVSIFSGCSLWRETETSPVTFASTAKPEFPFTVHEPDVYQAELIVRSGDVERRLFVARDHEKQRTDYDVGTDDHRAVIVSDKLYVVYFKRNSYTERPVTSDLASLYEPLTASILNFRDYAEFDEVSRAGSVVEYRARINGSAVSDTSIFFDESIKMPVRHEVYSLSGGERKLEYSTELQNIKTEVDDATFEIPRGFKKLTSTR